MCFGNNRRTFPPQFRPQFPIPKLSDQFGQSLGFLIFPENLKIFETFESSVRKNRVGQVTAELNEMVQ